MKRRNGGQVGMSAGRLTDRLGKGLSVYEEGVRDFRPASLPDPGSGRYSNGPATHTEDSC